MRNLHRPCTVRRLDLRRELGISPPLCSISETRGRQPTELITPSAPQPQNRRMKSSTSPETRSLETSSISSRTITRMVRHPARDLVERETLAFSFNSFARDCLPPGRRF